MSYEHIRLERSAAQVATVTLKRPDKLNALSAQTVDELRAAVGEVAASDARCLLLAGEGRGFSSGADLVGNGLPDDAGEALEKHFNPLIEAIFALDIPVVAAVQGPVAGAGCSLALSADIVIAARYDDEAWEELEAPPLEALRALLAECRIALPEGLPAAAAGLFGYLGYDMVRLVERLPDDRPDPLGLPDAVLLRPSVVAVLDGVKGDVILVAPAWSGSGLSPRAAFAQAAERVADAQRAIERGVPVAARALAEPRPPSPPVSNFTRDGYLAAVARAKEYIRAGDVFQVVPAQRWRQEFREPPFALYRSLRRTNPSPFMFFFNFGGFQVIGASPEILVRVMGGQVTIRPIAGTRPRGATPDEDRALEAELLGDQKERAEHLMLLDLGRNDVGRVAKPGTVRPTETFTVERYSHVMHIVSNVVGELAPGQDALSALMAGMPAGTVSGAPKVRAMEIIDELEPEKRGVYGGGCGYFSAGGDMDMCIALRTAVLKGTDLFIQSGGGVVFDSDPEAEWWETVHKSNAIRRAAEDAAMFSDGANG